MPKIRVLVVDDSAVIRRIVSDVLVEDPEIEVAGVAPNGRIALQRLAQLNPDLVTLDIEMPEMDGLEALVEIRKTHPRLPVIMFSTLTTRGGEATLDALAKGASDYLAKPSNTGSMSTAIERLRSDLIPKVKALCARTLRSGVRPAVVAPAAPRLRQPLPTSARIDAIAIAVSTGGPNALQQLLPALPGDLPVPLFIVQHMPPVFTKLLADRLCGLSQLSVREATDGAVARPGTAWIAPGDHHMVVRLEKGTPVIRLNQDAPENSCRPAADPLFRSVAAAFGGAVLGVVLTGMGQDGFRGSQTLVAAGARVIAQDEATSVVWGMPGFVAGASLADKVLPLGEIAGEIARRANAGRNRMALVPRIAGAAG